MKRRKTAWGAVAARAKAQPGRWFLHPTLVSCDDHLYEHARRRVPALRPTADGSFEFKKMNRGRTELGAEVYDLFTRFVPTKENHEHDA